MSDIIEVAKEQDFTFEVLVLSGTGDPDFPYYGCILNADALLGATSLVIKPLAYALSNGDMLRFDNGLVVTLGADAAAGVTSLTVTAIGAALRSQQVANKLQDLTGFTIQCKVYRRAGDTTALITYSGASVVLLTQGSASGRGRVQISGLVADTSAIAAGNYFGAVWRRNSGTMRPLKTFEFRLSEKGFIT